MSNTDALVVASKLKTYVKDTHGLSTSASVIGAVSDIVRQLADQAADRAKADGRKTVKDRDVVLPGLG